MGITLNSQLNWQSHINKTANKINKTTGILNKLKHIFPENILSTMYTSLILPHNHISYGILLMGH